MDDIVHSLTTGLNSCSIAVTNFFRLFLIVLILLYSIKLVKDLFLLSDVPLCDLSFLTILNCPNVIFKDISPESSVLHTELILCAIGISVTYFSSPLGVN